MSSSVSTSWWMTLKTWKHLQTMQSLLLFYQTLCHLTNIKLFSILITNTYTHYALPSRNCNNNFTWHPQRGFSFRTFQLATGLKFSVTEKRKKKKKKQFFEVCMKMVTFKQLLGVWNGNLTVVTALELCVQTFAGEGGEEMEFNSETTLTLWQN